MSRSILQRRLVDVSERLKRLRVELAVTEEQLVFLEEEAEDARSGARSLPKSRPPTSRRAMPAARPTPAPATATRSGERSWSSSVSRTALLDLISAELSAR